MSRDTQTKGGSAAERAIGAIDYQRLTAPQKRALAVLVTAADFNIFLVGTNAERRPWARVSKASSDEHHWNLTVESKAANALEKLGLARTFYVMNQGTYCMITSAGCRAAGRMALASVVS